MTTDELLEKYRANIRRIIWDSVYFRWRVSGWGIEKNTHAEGIGASVYDALIDFAKQIGRQKIEKRLKNDNN